MDGRGAVRKGSAEDADERRRLSTLDLVGLAAGGVVGSGWLMAVSQTKTAAQQGYAMQAWVIGGALMLLIAAVMVELGIALPKTGGLIFLPLQAAGPLLATVVAAGLWIAYAANPASEAWAMVQGLAYEFPSLLSCPKGAEDPQLSGRGWLCAVAFLTLIVGLNFLPPRRLIRLNLIITAVKVLIVVLIVVCLGFAGFRFGTGGAYPLANTDFLQACVKAQPQEWWPEQGSWSKQGSGLTMLLGSSVIYAYIGFQAPLDCAGNVKRRGMGEAARLRWAVYGSLVGAFLLYTALQWVFNGLGHQWTVDRFPSPYYRFAADQGMAWMVWLIGLNAVLSPMGSGLVFTYALTREVAALSRHHLTHRGLQTARRASFRFRGAEIDVCWMILLVNFTVSLTMLAMVGSDWHRLSALNSGLTLLVYAIAGVVLVALPLETFGRTRRGAHMVLSYAAFIAIALVIHSTEPDKVWPGMVALGVGSALLLLLPFLARRDLPLVGRLLGRYDAKDHLFRFADPKDAAVRPLLLFVAYLVVLLVCTLLREGRFWVTASIVVLSAAVVFPLLVRASSRYLDQVPFPLPSPRAEPQAKSPVTEGT
ncbi:APC family permease [Streptomyces sp. NPDC051677]|uniref:APC family permease n=1 Tax=Streptomyces sp. NPDC051677 TaxID=3365669 RepID=UPI0037D01D9F